MYIVTNVTATPAASSINGNVVTWEKFNNPRLKGQFVATYEISFTQNVGLFQATLDVSSQDSENTPITASSSFSGTTRVEDRNTYGASTISTSLYQNNQDIPIQTSNDKRNPVYFDRLRNGLKEMDDDELEVMCARVLSNICLLYTSDAADEL